ncbi:hypothetical protein N7532_000697 [Penicillium argentinense]|uniref:Immediate-early protein n=1 Tax=Penicillium argentinense TaxID=1131581 RepID=A0A9W9KP36_9EURO|nr:uncharacterized protein N7532_000697 [Penicillium argentinense]KAJ5112652.1 hypothetical protein N7532_000697 [Penicillium argentinense]
MFSQFVTAAKGLFTRQESEDTAADPAGTDAATTSRMVTATRQRAAKPEHESKVSGVAKGGKRKAQAAATEKTEDKQSKRRKRDSLEAAEATTDDDVAIDTLEQTNGETKSSHSKKHEPKGHFRFDSEEPSVPKVPLPQPAPQVSNDDDEDDSDDDAPETIDNSAQLLKIKEQAKRQEKLKQQEEQAKREKRRKLDERRKVQAKSSKIKEIAAPSEDLHSESTTTLQGSTTQDARRRTLPALLPDDILNAEPMDRAPTPPAEDSSAAPKKSNKLRFLDRTEKAPKDMQVGDVTIRVLDAPSTKSQSKPALAPKASKAGRNVKDNWLKRERSTAKVNGLRRTTGGSSGFVRR